MGAAMGLHSAVGPSTGMTLPTEYIDCILGSYVGILLVGVDDRNRIFSLRGRLPFGATSTGISVTN